MITRAKFILILFLLLLSQVSKAQWYSSKTNNNEIYNDSTGKLVIWALHDSLQHGKSFADLAFRYSQDPTSYREGGELKSMAIDSYVNEYQDVIWKLSLGQVSKPFKNEYGYSLIQLLSKEDNVCVIRSILIRTD